MATPMSAAPRFLFTLTGGRTGTAWLAKFLSENLGFRAVHELQGIDDFGTRMPDIKLMRTFNDRGNTELVQAFWRGKLAEIGALDRYAETNHTLGKCGLIENLLLSPLAADSAIIVLRRNKLDQCVSYLQRSDFLNTTIQWQWYLHPAYRNNILDPTPFVPFGQLGYALWYIHEMELRQHYYLMTCGERLRFIEADLEVITTPAGARGLLAAIGCEREPTIPEASNRNDLPPDAELVNSVRNMLAGISFDAPAIVRDFIASGRRVCLTG